MDILNDEYWEACLERIVAETEQSIKDFSAEHADEEISHVIYDVNAEYGALLLSFETTQASKEYAAKRQEYTLEKITKWIDRPNWRRHAYKRLKEYTLVPFCDSPGDFSYVGYSEMTFLEWDEFSRTEQQTLPKEGEATVLDTLVSVVLWKAIDTLVSKQAFSCLKLAHPAYLGYCFHDDQLVVTRMLNFG